MNETTITQTAVGDSAPDLVYRNGAGEAQRLSSRWADGPALIVWLRHLG